MQITGLIGDRGILPAWAATLPRCLDALGLRGYWSMPTIFWLAHGDRFLKAVCLAGVAIAVLLLSGLLAGYLGAACAGLLVHPLSFAMHRRSGFPVVPVGLAAAGDRVSGHLPRQLENRGVAISVAAVSPDVSVGGCEADQPRSGVARLDGARVSLHDAAAAHLACLVHVSAAARVPALFDRRDVVRRAGDSVSVFRASALAVLGRVASRCSCKF